MRRIVNAFGDTSWVKVDSLGGLLDSLGEKIDTTWVVYKDSTSRIEQFVYKRTDEPAVEMFPHHHYSLFLNVRSPAYSREVTLDTTGQFITVREKINGLDVKVPTTLTLDEYIHQRYEEEKLNNWRTFTREYTIRKEQDQLGNFLNNLTNVDIPVPANPLLSIFGKPIINLHISGAVDIKGAFRSQQSDQVVQNSLDISHTEPDFNQQVQINVSGTVGDKLNILADWNTQRTFEYENQLKIKYTGYEDEVVQSVEAGNVSLAGSSLIGGGQALFGVKARMQMGPLTLTALASQKKGQQKEVALGAQGSALVLHPYDYSHSYFFVDLNYRQYWEPLHAGTTYTATEQSQRDRIVQIDVFESITAISSTDRDFITAHAYTDLPARASNQTYPPSVDVPDSTGQGRSATGFFRKLQQGKDYFFNTSGIQAYGGYIVLNTPPNDNQALAVTYTTVDGRTYGDEFDTTKISDGFASSGYYILKLIKPAQELIPSLRPAWDLQLRNVYALGGSNLKKEGFSFQVYRRPVGGDTTKLVDGQYLITALGLDRFDDNNQPGHDSKFDFIEGVTIDVGRAEIIFPTLRPFDSTLVQYYRSLNPSKVLEDEFVYSDVYDTTRTAAQNNAVKNKYEMYVNSSSNVRSSYPLGFNVVEGSVKVLLGGAPLVLGTDYTVDYIVGEVVIKKPEALLPGAPLQILYEQNDLFQLASKTLLGARGELNLFPNTALGFTIMDLNQSTLSDKVRLGEEPTNNMMIGTDFSTSMNLPFLTGLIDDLPLIRTREMSNIRVSGEVAYSIPDPNTKKSTIPSDNNLSVAYIDDFEGARRTVTIDLIPTAWHLASPPAYSLLGPMDEVSKTYAKARLWWYNNTTSFFPVLPQDLRPNRQTRQNDRNVTVLNLDYNPNHRGLYNYSPNLDSTLHRIAIDKGGGETFGGRFDSANSRQKNWNGIMRYIAPITGNVLEQNIKFLEIWVNVPGPNQGGPGGLDIDDVRKGRLYIDLGRINEDVIPNKKLNSEARAITADNPSGIPRSFVTDQSDLGLDTLADPDEQIRFHDFVVSNSGDPDVEPGDPSGDDYRYTNNGTDFSHINGTEGNGKTTPNPDTEDLNNNGDVDLNDEYTEYEIPVDTLYTDSLGVNSRNPYVVGGNYSKGWYQIRVPLLEASRVVGGGSEADILQNVQFMRMWLSGFSKPLVLRIGEIDLVGNQWLLAQTDSMMQLSVVNIEDNPEYNTADYQRLGIVRETDKTDPTQLIQENEGSLAMILNGIPVDSSREAYKNFVTRPMNLFNYKTMKMFVHGDATFQAPPVADYSAEIYVRFGADTANYYEYKQPIWPGWNDNNFLNMSFAEITAVKAARDSVHVLYRVPAHNGIPNATYGVRGNPSLRSIAYIGIGIVNPNTPNKNQADKLYGQVWVNELRLVDADNSKGYAYRFDTQIKLADLGSVGFNYSKSNPTFHGLDQSFGDQNDHTNWQVSASMDLTKLFPQDWQGTGVNVSYSHGESYLKPKYIPGTDIAVNQAAERAGERPAPGQTAAQAADQVIVTSQSLHVQDAYAITNFKIVPANAPWYIRDTFSKLSLSYNYSSSRDRDPVTESRRLWGWNAGASYAVGLPTDYYVQPFKGLFEHIFLFKEFKDWKIYFMPITNFSAHIGANRSRSYEVTRGDVSNPRDTRAFGVNKGFGFGWKLTEGGLTNLSGEYSLSLNRNLLNYDNDTSGRSFGSILKSIFIRGQDNQYSQRLTVNSKPKIPNIFEITKYLDLSAGYGVDYGWQNSFQNGDLGKSAGFSNNIQLGMTFRLKSLTDPWFRSSDEPDVVEIPRPQETKGNDSTKTKDVPEQGKGGGAKDLLKQFKNLARLLIKIPLLDYETIQIQFNQTNRAGNSGVVGSTGFLNFWGRSPFQGSVVDYGPSRLYQLGLISDPSGTLHYSPSSSFPFIGWRVEPGLRAANALLQNTYNQANNISLRTNRPLWEGATISIDWKVGWQFNKSISFQTGPDGRPAVDPLGNLVPAVVTTGGSIERSYLSLPPFLFFKVFHSDLTDVGKKYDLLVAQGVDPRTAISQSFENGLEALPFLNKLFGSFVPRPNWNLRWDGIERIAGLRSIFDRLSLENAYTASFRRDFRGDVGGGEITDIERVTFGFNPLASVNATFKELWKGSLSGNIRINTSTIYDLNLAAQNIAETFAREISFTMTYSRHGFKLPLFGLSFNNDADISLTFSQTKNSRREYDPTLLSSNQTGIPLDGNTRTNIEPRLRYVLSSRVSAAVYYRYTRTAPDEGGSSIFGTTTNEAGIDLHLSVGSQ